MQKLILVRKGSEVYYNDVALTINAQASKGPGNEVVKVEGLQEANGQKWISLNRLVEGTNELTLQGRSVTRGTKAKVAEVDYILNIVECDEVTKLNEQIAKLEAQVEAIKDAARARFVPKPNFDIDPSTLDESGRADMIAQVEKWMDFMNKN